MSSQSKATARPASVDHYLDRFARVAARSEQPGWLRARRDEAIDRFGELGLPGRGLEDWRYTSIAAIERARFELPETVPAVSRDALAAITTSAGDASRAIFVDGRFAPELSDMPAPDSGIRFDSLEAALKDRTEESLVSRHLTRLAEFKENAFCALNTAFLSDGAVIEIARDSDVVLPLHLLFVSTGRDTIVHPRVLVVARQSSRATIVQEHVSLGAGERLTNVVAELTVEANARLDHVVLQRECAESFHVSNLRAAQARDSRLALHTFTLDGRLVRNELGVVLCDRGAEVDLRGLFLGAETRHVDNQTSVDHAMPHCTSRELYKGVLGDQSRGVFHGRVLVRPDAQKTDAQQSNPNLLLTDRAEIDTKPQLEIYADDVKCSHGATIGQLDKDALFYLRARGLAEHDARACLTRGFAHEICEGLPNAGLARWIESLVDGALEAVILRSVEEGG
jgi:Fe-S cluster assembly protein SufD